MNSPIRIICFDLGGVLVRICRTWAQGCHAAGVPIHDGADDPQFLVDRRDLNLEYQAGQLKPMEFFDRLSVSTDGLYSPGDVKRVHDAWLLGEYPGVAELVQRLNALPRIATACLSNTDDLHWGQMIRGFPAVAELQHRHASHLLGICKPDSAIFAAFEDLVKAQPHEIAFFEDSLENVEAARSAGWSAHLVDHTQDTAPQISTVLKTLGIFS